MLMEQTPARNLVGLAALDPPYESRFGSVSHPVDDLDSKQIKPEFQGLRREVAERQPAVAAGRMIRP